MEWLDSVLEWIWGDLAGIAEPRYAQGSLQTLPTHALRRVDETATCQHLVVVLTLPGALSLYS